MNRLIRKLTSDEIKLFVDIAINAYPGVMQNTPEFKDRLYTNLVDLQEKEDSIDLFGLFQEGKLIGGMRIHYFTMNLFSNPIDVGGVGLVAVDLLHKKEKVAKELVQYFIQYFKEKGTSLVMLYPFRPDFYKKMGFGYGVKMNKYHVVPSSFPNVTSKDGLIYLDESHKELIEDCYNRFATKTHGMIKKTKNEINSICKNPDNKLIGFMNDGKIEGYILFSFKKLSETNFLQNDLNIKEFIYENPLALAKLNTFIHTQADQIRRVILKSQDNSLQYLFSDPRNESIDIIPSVYHETNQSGVGLMYKIIDMNRFLNQISHINFNDISSSFTLKITDTFDSNEPIVSRVNLLNGYISNEVQKESEFEVELDISDLSSLFMGAVEVNRLYQYGLLKLDNINYLETLEKIFMNRKQPICVTAF